MSQTRQLAAIMFTDIVGYTALMGNDEENAFSILNKNRALQKPIIEQFNGRWIKELGDGVMASFNTVSDAVNAAIKIQESCNAAKDFQLRIGIHLGEVVFENDDVFGDGVNIASRIQSIAKPGTIYVSETVRYNVSNKKDIHTQFVKEETLKNVKEPVCIYEVRTKQTDEFSYSALKERFTKIPEKSVAVLPFVNMSNDPEQEYFSDGMAEELLNSLAHLKDLKVAGRTSSFQFKGKNIDLREVGDKLKVKTVLEGSIRKQGNKIRITAQLINIDDGYHLWSEKYDRELDDIFAIQDDIAFAITEKLKVTLLDNDREAITKIHTDSTKAYELYLQGRYFWNSRNKEALENSIKYFQKAIEKDPNYALAWSGLADSYNLLNEYGNIPRKEAYTKAKASVSKALEIDDHVSEAHISLASLLMLDEFDWINAGREFKLGVDLNPNYATAHHWYSEWLMYMGRFDEALAEISAAADLDPISLGILKDRGIILYYSRQYDKVIPLAKAAIELDCEFAAFHRLLTLAYEGKKMFDLALAANNAWGIITGNHFKTTIFRAQICAASEKKDEAKEIVKSLSADDIQKGNDYRGLALIYVALGEFNMAFEFLEKSYESHERSLCSLKIDPKLDPLRPEPRFADLLNRMNFPQ